MADRIDEQRARRDLVGKVIADVILGDPPWRATLVFSDGTCLEIENDASCESGAEPNLSFLTDGPE